MLMRRIVSFSRTIEWMAMKFGTDINDLLRVNYYHSGDISFSDRSEANVSMLESSLSVTIINMYILVLCRSNLVIQPNLYLILYTIYYEKLVVETCPSLIDTFSYI